MAYLCCSFCSIRVLPTSVESLACPSCDRALELRTPAAALGYRLLEIEDPIPLSPTAAAAAIALFTGPAEPRVW
jgi:hypothetical protein